MAVEYLPFLVPGVSPKHNWVLFGCKNFRQYVKAVESLQAGKCELCPPDPVRNKILPVSTHRWLVWKNTVAPLPGQEHQFMIVPRRHIEKLEELNADEWAELWHVLQSISVYYGLTGYSLLVRSGDPTKNAKSVRHLHFNMHVADGTMMVQPTIGKSLEDLKGKYEVLKVFESLRVHVETGGTIESAVSAGVITQADWNLVADRIDPPKKVDERDLLSIKIKERYPIESDSRGSAFPFLEKLL